MAFQDVNSGNFVKATSLAVGEAYEGYVIGFVESQQYEQTNIVMQNYETNERETFATAGNLKYMIKDGKIAQGQLTRITRLEDKTVKGKKSTQFKVEQDPEQTLSDAQFAAIPAADLKPTSTKKSAADVKATAEKLRSQVG